MNEKTTCSQCIHWIERKQDAKGICHAMPPNGLGFPLTHPDDWCGQAKQKETAIEPRSPSQSQTFPGRARR